MDILKIVLASIISSGIIGFVIKKFLENSIKNTFDKSLEKYKSELEIKRNVSQKVNDEQIQLYKRFTEIIYRSRNQSRYVLALIGDFYTTTSNDETFKEYSQYLRKGDNLLTSKEIYIKISDIIKELEKTIDESTELAYTNRLIVGEIVFRYIHDYKNVIRPILYSDERFNNTKNSIEELKKNLTNIESSYKKLDLFYKELVIAIQVNYRITI